MDFAHGALRLLGHHVLPGIVFIILSAAALCVWDVQRLSGTADRDTRRWFISMIGVAFGIVSCVFMTVRFTAAIS